MHSSGGSRRLVSVVLGAVVALVAPRAAAAAPPLPTPLTEVWFDAEPGDGVVYQHHLVLPDLRVEQYGTYNVVYFSATAPGGPSYWLMFAAPDAALLTVGTYEAAERALFRSPGHPGIDIYGDGRGCNEQAGRFIVDQITLDGSGVPLVFSARFEQHCEGSDVALFGAISFNATAPFRTRSLSSESLDFGSQAVGSSSAPQTWTVTNDGPSPLAVADLRITGADAADFAISPDGCTGVEIASGGQCSVGVRFDPISALGVRSAKLTLFDDSAPLGGGGTGRDVALTGTTVAAPPPPPPPDPSGEFTPLTPQRILDTRDGTGGFTTPLGPLQTIDVQIAGTGGVPTDGVAAVVMNVTATDPTAATFVTIWPAGIARPPNSNLNVTPGVTVPNLVTVALGAGGRVSAFNLAGTTHVIFDVVGYYADQRGPFGSRFHGVDPFRLFDTRAGSGSVPTVALNAGGILSIDVRGRGSIPASGVTGLVMNVTVTEPDASSYLTVFPGDVTMPTTSNLNFGPRQTVPNLVTIRVPASGVLRFYNFAGTTHVLADVVGYYDENRSGNTGRFVALTPSRLADTRAGSGALGPRDWGILQVAGRGGLPTTGVGSVVLNTTVTEPTASGFLTVFPDDLCKVPLASNLNFVPGLTVPNLVIVRISTMTDCAVEAGAVDFFNSAGSTHVVVDLFGYFAE